MWQRIHASFDLFYSKKHQCNSYICKMYVNIYEPKQVQLKWIKKNAYCVCLSKCLQHFYSNNFNLHVWGTLESSSYLELHEEQLSDQINRLIGFCVMKQSIISIKLCNNGAISFHRGNVPSSRYNCAGKHFILQRPCTTHMWKINAKLLIVTCRL